MYECCCFGFVFSHETQTSFEEQGDFCVTWRLETLSLFETDLVCLVCFFSPSYVALLLLLSGWFDLICDPCCWRSCSDGPSSPQWVFPHGARLKDRSAAFKGFSSLSTNLPFYNSANFLLTTDFSLFLWKSTCRDLLLVQRDNPSHFDLSWFLAEFLVWKWLLNLMYSFIN